jgi:hypothetical protein
MKGSFEIFYASVCWSEWLDNITICVYVPMVLVVGQSC